MPNEVDDVEMTAYLSLSRGKDAALESFSFAFHHAPAEPFDAEEVEPADRSEGLDCVYFINRPLGLLLQYTVILLILVVSLVFFIYLG